MALSFDVRFQKTYVYRGKRKSTHWVRWTVDGKPFKEPFGNDTLAESFRSQLNVAARRGEGFDTESGLPVSMARRERPEANWYTFACQYMDMKWPRAAGTARRSTAEALMTVTVAMLSGRKGQPDSKAIRSALFNWAFNTAKRDSAPDDVVKVLKWVERNSRAVAELEEAEVLRSVLNAVASKLDGTAAAATVVSRKRAVLFNAVEFAVEKKLLDRNPLPSLKWSPPKTEHEIDPRVVPNPIQARTLLRAVGDVRRAGPRLRACYACSYYAALRPEEAINLRRNNIKLPPRRRSPVTGQWEPMDEWGEFHLEGAAPHAGSRWTDAGTIRDRRGLKHRPRKATRPVPIPPELVAVLWEHLDQFGTDDEGRLFRGERGGDVPVRLYNEVWRKAREAVFTPDVAASPLARRPYDLRHACVSTQLNAGVEPTKVAKWAGQSVKVLLEVYAKCLYGGDEDAKRKIRDALR